jgi:hypothetical protein
MKFLAFLLNLPWTILGIILALISIPVSLRFDKQHLAFIFKVKRLWFKKHARAAAFSHVVYLSDRTEHLDLEHELVHVQQYTRMPLLQPFLYQFETIRKGYRNNKYEVEAYALAGNEYKER